MKMKGLKLSGLLTIRQSVEIWRENSNDKRQQDKGRKMEYFWGNGEIPLISSEIKPPLEVQI